MMASVKKKHSKPELFVRSYLHQQGIRFMLHDRRLPGTPDIVLPKYRAAVLVHGCFWHRCPHCAVGSQKIRSNLGYWIPKLERNQARDIKVQQELSAAGWRSLVVWECQVADEHVLKKLVANITRRSTVAKSSVRESS
jgi:DNA mismatch endonuclease, patch repair protein